jgi:hypothetical protein
MPDLEDTLIADGDLDQLASFGRGSGKGFLNQHVNPASEEISRNREMKLSWNGDTDTIHMVEELTVVCRCLRVAFSRDRRSTSGVHIRYADQCDIRLSGIFLGMETTQVADSYRTHA